jgi:hypothetical protein
LSSTSRISIGIIAFLTAQMRGGTGARMVEGATHM